MSSQSERKPDRRSPEQTLRRCRRERALQLLDERMTQQVSRLQAILAKGPRPSETRHEFVARLFDQLELILHRARSRRLEIAAGVKRPAPGRPPDPALAKGPKPTKKMGRPETFTREIENQFVEEVDAIKARAAEFGSRLNDTDALLIHLGRCLAKQFVTEGKSTAEAQRLAKSELGQRRGSPDFAKVLKRRREHLSRIRRERKSSR